MTSTPAELESALRKSFAVIQQLKLELAQAHRVVREPIAIVAMSCRFPGSANSPEAFWQTLCEGRDNLSEIPADRWNWQQFYNPEPDIPGTHYVRNGYFIDRVGDFDPDFFGISRREASSMDPQHRLMLEVSWETLERAALSPDRLRGSRTGVFVGIGQNDYSRLQMYGGVPERITPYDGTGISFCFAAARLSYSLGLNGPNLAVDTACSSSLVALHLACNSLANRECDHALAGGSHLIISPEITIYLSRLKALSPDGRSRAFSADANGYGRGEGCGMLLLKRLSDARRDGDPVLAVIRGSAVNHGGAGSGLTVPNGLAQQMLLRDALERAELKPSDIGWIEAHGTGTALGDPIEVAALAEVFGQESRAGRPLYLSSVKTNIGHLEAAAGVAGVIKAVLALQHGELPAHLHLGTANPNIDWSNLPFHIPTVLTPWTAPLVAGVSAFGLGGTNAHVIIAAADADCRSTASDEDEEAVTARPLLLSARTPEALVAHRDAFAAFLEKSDAPYSAIVQTAALGRRHFEYRLAVTANSATDAAARLRGANLSSLPIGRSAGAGRTQTAFLFTGQGSQYCGMGRTLWQQEPAFRSAVAHCADLIERAAGWTPLAFIDANEDDPVLDQTAYTQPTLFALQVGLVSLWRAWGVCPDIVIGHSIGEFAAAWCAGVLSLEDAIRLVIERGRLMQRLPAGGGMAALRLDESAARRAIAPFPPLALAAVNSPQSVTVSGPLPELEECLQQLERQGVLCQPLTVSHAFHSSLMQPMLDDFTRILDQIPFSPPKIRFIATCNEQSASVDCPTYWREQIHNTVCFAAAAERLADLDVGVVIEIGPAAPLLALAQQSTVVPEALWLPSLERRNPDAMAESLARLYSEGVDVRWSDVFSGPRRPVLLPTYPFQRHRFWIASDTAGKAGITIRPDADEHPLLGTVIASPLATQQYTIVLSARQPAFLGDHRIMGEVVFPAAGFIEAALAAAARHFGQTSLRLVDIKFQQPLSLADGQPCRLQLLLTPQASECVIAIHSSNPDVQGGPWLTHMTCRTLPLPSDATPGVVALGAPGTLISGTDFYRASRERGIDYGPAFQTLQDLQDCGDNCGRARYTVLPQHADPRYLLPPVLLDSALQALAAARPDLGRQTYIPVGIDQLDVAPERCLSGEIHTRIDDFDVPGRALCSFQICNTSGLPWLSARGVHMQRISALNGKTAQVWIPRWMPVATTISESERPHGHWLILGDAPELAMALGCRLRAAGCRVSEWPIQPVAQPWPEIQDLTGVCVLALYADLSPVTASHELRLIQHFARLPENEQPALLFATCGAQAVEAGGERPESSRGALWGLARVARNENPVRPCHCVDLDPLAHPDENSAALLIECAALQSAPDTEREDQVAWRFQNRYALRLQAPESATADRRVKPGRLACKVIGDLDSLCFVSHQVPPPGPGEIQIRVRAAGLNFKDVLHALGALDLPAHGAFGFDAAGVVEALGSGGTDFSVGDRVMLTLTPGALGDLVNARSDFVYRVPSGLDFASAAGLPLAYLTAWHALVHVARLQAGESVLIHAAAGGVGQAALAIARYLGARIHATASPAKQHHLRHNGVHQIYNSRTADFRDELLAATAGRGVDVVLNCLNGDLISASFDTLISGGRFVEIGKTGIWPEAMALAYRPDVAYSVFDLADVAMAEPTLIGQMLGRLTDYLERGELPPLPVQAFGAEDTSAAFRLVSRSRHVGKVVVTFPRPSALSGVQLITGGLGALGRLLCRTLVGQGEKKLALLVRKVPDAMQQTFLNTLGDDVRVATYVVDLDDTTAMHSVVARVIDDFSSPINSVYHAAGVLADGTLAQQTDDSFARVMRPKLLGAWNLHLATRGMDLERFVLFSSAAALIGTPGQSNYAAANAGLDALAAARRGAGLPALSVNWGPWAETGMASRLAETDKQRMSAAGITPLQADAAWNTLFQLSDSGVSQALVMNVDWPLFVARLPGAANGSLLRDLTSVRELVRPTVGGTQPNARPRLGDRLAALTAEQRRHELLRQLQQRVAVILGRPHPEEISPAQGFFAMGMDSLTSMELRSGLQRELDLTLPPTLAFDYGNIEALADYLIGRVPSWQAPIADASTENDDGRDDLSQLSEAELAEMLTRELQTP